MLTTGASAGAVGSYVLAPHVIDSFPGAQLCGEKTPAGCGEKNTLHAARCTLQATRYGLESAGARHYHFADSYAPVFGQTGYNDGLQNWKMIDALSPHVKIDPATLAPWRPLINAYSLNLTALAYPHARFPASW